MKYKHNNYYVKIHSRILHKRFFNYYNTMNEDEFNNLSIGENMYCSVICYQAINY